MSAGDGHGQRLSGVDASFLRLEGGHAHMHMGFSAVFSLPAGATRPALPALRARVASRLHLLPRCRQRVHGAPLGLGEPRWIDDPRFTIDEHVTALTGPEEVVTTEDFAALRDAMLSEPLPRDRPLWHILLIPRLHDGGVGVIGRVHHAMADASAALSLAALLLDTPAEPAAGGDPAPVGRGEVLDLPFWHPRPAPGAGRWALDPLTDSVRLTWRTLGGAAGMVRRPRSSIGRALSGGRRVAMALREDALPRAPRCALNAEVGSRRTLIGYRTAAPELRDATAGGTLNDAGLAVIAGALRSLTLRGGQPATPLKVMIPVSLRRARQRDQMGNRLSSAALWLPLDHDSPAARLQAVREQTARLKHTRRHEGTAALLAGVEHFAGPPQVAAFRAAASPRSYNLLVSYIPGPRERLSTLGARLEKVYPAVPIGHHHALAIGMLSYDDQLHFGLHADPDALPDVSELPDLLADEVAALVHHGQHEGGTVTPLFADPASPTGRFSRTTAPQNAGREDPHGHA